MSSLMNIGVTGLNAAQAGLVTTGHNISNASTPGYSRQSIIQTSVQPQFTGGGFLGQGTTVSTVQRLYSQYLNAQVQSVQASQAQLSAYSDQIGQIDNILADSNAGLSPALQDFFNGVQAMANNPASVPSRQAMLSTASSLVARFNNLDQTLQNLRDGVNSQVKSSVTTINALARQVADMNQRIVVVQASGGGQPANDLLDQRDQLVTQLNQQIGVTTSQDSDGSINVFIGNGQALVVGSNAASLAAAANTEDSQRLSVSLTNPNGSQLSLPDAQITGGTLGGLMAFRSETLDKTENSLGRIATTLAQSFNDQNKLGQDLNGNLGGDIFTVAPPVVLANPTNQTNASISATLQPASNQGAYTVQYTAAGYSITHPDGTVTSSSTMPITLREGLSLSLKSGTPQTGDSFTIMPGNPSGLRSLAATGNTSNAVMDSTSYLAGLTGSDYRLQYDGSNFQLTRLADNQPMGSFTLAQLTSANGLTVDGVTLKLTNGVTPAAGDSYLIEPTRNGAKDLALALNDPKALAAASTLRTVTPTNNTGSAAIDSGTVVDMAKWTAASNQNGYSIKFQAANGVTRYDIVDNTTNTSLLDGAASTALNYARAYVPGQPIQLAQTGAPAFDLGAGVTITGQPGNGDSFTIRANTGAVADNRNALAMGQMQTENILEGRSNYQSAYSQLVAEVGNKTRETSVNFSAQSALLNQAESTQQSLSGVNLDEEAANLIRYQQAYQASGKVIQIASKLFEQILQM